MSADPMEPRGAKAPRPLGWALICSAVLFWLGAVTPPYRQWMGVPLEEYLAIVAAHRTNWLVMHALFAAGTVLALAALAALASLLRHAGDRVWSAVGSTLFAVAATLWLVCVAFRVTVTLRVAEGIGATREVPVAFVAYHELMGALFGTFMLLSYLSMAAYGAALLATGLLRPATARFALTFGALAVPGLATPVFQPPLMVFVVPFALGLGIVRARTPEQR